jgi:ribonuclease P protein component
LLDQSIRLKKNKEFRYTYKRGRSLKGKYLVIYFCENGQENSKIGFSVSKKIGKAIIRNRIKRVLREICRINKNKIVQGYNIIFVARSKIKGIKYRLVEEEMLDLLKKAELLR